MWPFKKKSPAPAPETKRERGMFTTHGGAGQGVSLMASMDVTMRAALPKVTALAGTGMDNSAGSPSFKSSWGFGVSNLPDALIGWYASQSFIGYQMCAIIAQNWLIDKACTMPGRDAIRHGFEIQVNGEPGGMDTEIGEEIAKQNKLFRLNWNLEQFIRMGRVFGVRVAFFKVESPDPFYYEKPYNPDGVLPGSYRGIVQVDPYWCIPILDMDASSDPASPHFYDPTWWMISGKRYHRSHLCVFRNSEVPDVLKPMYNYGGISVPQKIMERVYAAERTANEGPQLAMTKRTLVWNTDVAAMLTNQDKFVEHMENWVQYRDNYGIKINDVDDTMAQFDTALSDLDVTIMTQYQLVAAGANVPATKLLGTTPKGFNATGAYEEASYHEELETIQSNDLTAMVDRHHEILLRSHIEPEMGLSVGSLTVEIDWAPVDSPTAEEYANINKLKADRDNIYVSAGAIDGMDVRARLKSDPNSEYTELQDIQDPAAGDDPLALVNSIMGVEPNGTATEAPAANPGAGSMGKAAKRGNIPGKPTKPPFGNGS